MEPEAGAEGVGEGFGGEEEVRAWGEVGEAVEGGGWGEGLEVDADEEGGGEGEEEDGGGGEGGVGRGRGAGREGHGGGMVWWVGVGWGMSGLLDLVVEEGWVWSFLL